MKRKKFLNLTKTKKSEEEREADKTSPKEKSAKSPTAAAADHEKSSETVDHKSDSGSSSSSSSNESGSCCSDSTTSVATAAEEKSIMTQKAFNSKSPYPPLAPNKLRVYSMRFCPYAQRARMILKYYNVPHEIVNINLKDKPAWFLQKNSSGTVPVLEHNDRIITESVICCEYLDERYGQNKLLTRESYTRAKQKMMIEKFNKVCAVYYAAINKLKGVEDFRDLKQQFEEVLYPFEESLQDKYFGGDEPYFLDFLIWPWFERFPALERLTGIQIVQGDPKFHRITQWADKHMLQVPVVRDVITPIGYHAEFLRQYTDPSLKYPNYDLGLQ